MRTYSNEQLKDIIEQEGLGYAIHCYAGAESIEDPEVKAAWEKASRAMTEISELLGLGY